MSEPKKLYWYVFIYNPSKNIVREVYIFNCESDGLSSCVKKLSKEINTMEEIILGKSITGTMYQISIEKYSGGSEYIREDSSSVAKYINIPKVGVAISQFFTKHNIWKLLKD